VHFEVECAYPYIDKSEEVSLYCESGNRSMMAKSMMEKAGFQNVTDLVSIDNLR
jgi:rhodanese-related sulfurtransferase